MIFVQQKEKNLKRDIKIILYAISLENYMVVIDVNDKRVFYIKANGSSSWNLSPALIPPGVLLICLMSLAREGGQLLFSPKESNLFVLQNFTVGDQTE